MATIIKIKRTTGSSAPSGLEQGELAYVYDTSSASTGAGGNGLRLFIGDHTSTSNAAIEIGGQYYKLLLDHAHGTLTASSAVIVDSSKRIDELLIGNNATTGGTIKFNEGTNNGAHFIALKSPNSVASSVTFTLPSADGSSGHLLTTDGSGNLSFAAPASSNFTLAADSGSNDTFTTGQTLTFTGGTGIDTTVADNEITFAIDSTVATLAGTQTLTNKTLTSPKINEDVAVTATATEINLLDGVTATTAELNILDGVTATAAELNILDGVTATAAEINLIDGGTARGTTAVVSGDGLLVNDGGTMRMTNIDTVASYIEGLNNRPAFYAYGAAATSVANSTLTRIAVASEVADYGGCYNNTSSNATLNSLTAPAYSFTPNVAGLYYFVGAIQLNTTNYNVGLVNNLGSAGGSETYAALVYRKSDTNNGMVTVSGYALMNGTGNNVSLVGYQESGSSLDTNNSIYTTFFGGFLVAKT